MSGSIRAHLVGGPCDGQVQTIPPDQEREIRVAVMSPPNLQATRGIEAPTKKADIQFRVEVYRDIGYRLDEPGDGRIFVWDSIKGERFDAIPVCKGRMECEACFCVNRCCRKHPCCSRGCPPSCGRCHGR